MQQLAKNIAESKGFQNFITGLIIFAGVLVGLETYPAIEASYGTALHLMDKIVLGIFILEIVIKMAAEGRKPWRYFKDPWNVFDFVIVAAAALLPFGGSAATVLRLLRLLRVLKLVRALPKLQLLVSALLKSIPSMGYVSLLLFMLFYVYAVAAVFMWGKNDPVHFGNLQISMVSLFRAVTLEDWTDLMYTQMFGCAEYGYSGMQHLCTASKASPAMGAGFFVSFVLVGTMIILNLFIGVIMKGMDEAQSEMNAESEEAAEPLAHVQADAAAMAKQLEVLQHHLAEAQRSTSPPFRGPPSRTTTSPKHRFSMPEPLPAE